MTEHPRAFPPVSSVLPHRAPFLFIEQVVELTEERVVAVRTFRPDEPFFLGHFPGRPVVPGVVLIEGLAQAMALIPGVSRSGATHGASPAAADRSSGSTTAIV